MIYQFYHDLVTCRRQGRRMNSHMIVVAIVRAYFVLLCLSKSVKFDDDTHRLIANRKMHFLKYIYQQNTQQKRSRYKQIRIELNICIINVADVCNNRTVLAANVLFASQKMIPKSLH